MASTAGIELRPHWWERSVLTTGPSLAPQTQRDDLRLLSTDAFFATHVNCNHVNKIEAR